MACYALSFIFFVIYFSDKLLLLFLLSTSRLCRFVSSVTFVVIGRETTDSRPLRLFIPGNVL